MRPVEAD